MKNNIVIIIATIILSTTIAAYSQQTNEEKVICNLAAQNCLKKSEILEKRIKKLNTELKKGSKSYSSEELKKIEQKLQETQDLLDKIEGNTSGK